MSNNESSQLIVIDRDELAEVEKLAIENHVDVEVVPLRGLEPVTTVTLIILGASTAIGAFVHVLEQRKGGQVLDLRPGVPRAAYRTPDVAYGLVVIIARDGRVTVEVKEPRGMFGTVMDTLRGITTDLGTAGAKAVSEVVSKSLGDVAAVTVEVAPDQRLKV